MKVLFISLLLFFTNIAEEKWKVAVDNTKKYTIEYPADWEFVQNGEVEMFKTPLMNDKDEFSENINIICVPNDNGATDYTGLEEAMATQLKDYVKGFKLISTGKVKLSGKEMLKINYYADFQGVILNLTQYFLLTKSTMIIVTVTSPEKVDPAFFTVAEKVIGTIKAM